MLTVAENMKGFQNGNYKRLARVWKVTRTDGVVFRFTSHDMPLTVLAESYTPNDAPNASAGRREAGIKEQDFDFRGVISSDTITTADLLAGRFDDAQIDERLVDWRYPWAGSFSHSRYWITKVTHDGEKFFADVTSLARWLRPKFGDVFGRTCRFDLGDANCGAAVPTTTGVIVEGMIDGEAKRIIRATSGSLSGAHADDYFNFGEVEFTSGANIGLKGEIKDYVQSTREITLQMAMPFRVAAADLFTIRAGCNKRVTDCGTKFTNIANFGGYPTSPTLDRVLRVTPRR